MVCAPRHLRTPKEGRRFTARQQHRDLRADARRHENHQREAENLSRASASRYCIRPYDPLQVPRVCQGPRTFRQMVEILHRQNQAP